MIISHKYKYLFVELPRTGSTTISKELCDNYDGTPILNKHDNYYKFLKIANNKEKKYFVFSCIRNPLDRTVSIFLKYKNKNKYYFNNLENSKSRLISNYYFNKRINYVKKNNADFSIYFLKFHKFPYIDWSILSHKDFNFVIRFENIGEDFAQVLKLIGIEQKRPLAKINITPGKDKDFISYYNNPMVIEMAKKVFAPFMKKWRYKFPSNWEEYSITWSYQLKFHLIRILKYVYWRFFK